MESPWQEGRSPGSPCPHSRLDQHGALSRTGGKVTSSKGPLCASRNGPGAKAPGPPHAPCTWRPRPWVLRRVICREVDPSIPFGPDQTVVLPALSRVGSRNTRGLLITFLRTGVTFLALVTVVVFLFLTRDVPPLTLLRVGLALTLGIVRVALLGLSGSLGRLRGGL